MSKKLFLLIAIVVLAVGGGIFWKVRDTQAKAARLESEILRELTTDDVVQMMTNQSLVEPTKAYAVVQSPETRKIFLNGLREYLALAARSRREGMADDPNIKASLEYKKNQLLASVYQNKLDNDLGKYYDVPGEQIDAFLSDPENEKLFQKEFHALRSIQRSVAENSGNPAAQVEIQGEALEKTRKEWARIMLLSNTAKNDADFMNQRAIQLRLKVAEAGVLAFNYLNKYWSEKVKPKDKEIEAYLSVHPEYDIRQKVEIAKMVLGRANAGDDFVKLAAEYSEDRTTKNSGGLYQDVVPGILWPEVEAAAQKLEKGQVASELIETQHGFHIVQLVERKPVREGGKDLGDKLSVRHILLRKAFEDPASPKNPDIPPPYLTPNEIAINALQNEKRKMFIDEVITSENISLPEDFPFEITEDLKLAGTRLEQVREKIEKDKKVAAEKGHLNRN